MAGRAFRLVSLLLITIILASACGSGSSPGDTTAGIQAASPGAELQELLVRELAALGKTVSDTETGLALGPDNIVFDLAATPVNNSVNLQWTERIAGDYNQDGLVSAEDLTPLGQFFGQTVEYEPAAEHGGFSRWPAGDPADGGEGALNWRKARIDGDGNGLIGIGDITMLAQHWQERGGGYAVYRRAEGETEFTRIVRVFNPRPNAPQPVVCKFQDNHWVAGVFEYYVAPYSPALDDIGAASVLVTVDLAAGTWERHPVAVLKASTDLAGAPAVVTFNAAQSYDSTGREFELHWDFEGDGVVDYTSGGPEPGTDWASSSGMVTDLIITGDNLLKVTYRVGSADWYWPEISAVNADGRSSLPATVRLGISGWELSILSTEMSSYPVGLVEFRIGVLSVDPGTGLRVVAGGGVKLESNEYEDGLHVAFETGEGEWLTELATGFDDPGVAEFIEQYYGFDVWDPAIFWQPNGQPAVCFIAYRSGRSDGRLYVASRHPDDTWTTRLIWEGSQDWKWANRGVFMVNFLDQGDGRFTALIYDIEDGSTENRTFRQYLCVYDNGEFQLEDSGFTTRRLDYPLSWLAGDTDGTVQAMGHNRTTAGGGCEIWGLRLAAPGNLSEVTLIGDGIMGPVENPIYSGITYTPDGTLYAVANINSDSPDYYRRDILVTDTGKVVPIFDTDVSNRETKVFRTCRDGSVVAVIGDEPYYRFEHDLIYTRYAPGKLLVEHVIDNEFRNTYGGTGFRGYAEGLDGVCHMVIYQYDSGSSPDSYQLLATRVDPSLN